MPEQRSLAAKRRRWIIDREQARDFLMAIKNQPCAECGLSFPAVCMDLHHVKGKKKFALTATGCLQHSQKAIRAEIKKCKVVCSNCHRIITQKQMIKRYKSR